MRPVLNIIGIILMLFGVILLVGTEGALKWENITYPQAIFQAVICFGFMILGGCLVVLTNDKDDKK